MVQIETVKQITAAVFIALCDQFVFAIYCIVQSLKERRNVQFDHSIKSFKVCVFTVSSYKKIQNTSLCVVTFYHNGLSEMRKAADREYVPLLFWTMRVLSYISMLHWCHTSKCDELLAKNYLAKLFSLTMLSISGKYIQV